MAYPFKARSNAIGTGSEKILFTADADDTGFDGQLGTEDDSEVDGTAGGFQGYWDPIQFLPGSTGNTLQHAELRFGGNANRGQIAIEQAELTLTNSRLLSGDFGISITEADPVISNVHFQSHKRSALTMDLLSNPDFENITFTGNATNGVEIPGGTLAANTNWMIQASSIVCSVTLPSLPA